ncbi:MAG TPA: NUDIX domain-containing protein [Acidobacteriota bacterium]|jgi:8-oxo-dGTP diphosphatase|nr:NUDIX domain-containing protein [Acidobacteriota bacterium]
MTQTGGNAEDSTKVGVIPVAVVVVRHRNRIWVRLRKETGHLDGCWEFPGGKVRKGERPVTAAVRELLEETGLQVEPDQLHPLSHFDFTYPERVLQLHFYLLELPDLPSMPFEEACWLTASELLARRTPPANNEVLKLLVRNSG